MLLTGRETDLEIRILFASDLGKPAVQVVTEGAGADGAEAVLLGEVLYADDGFQGFRVSGFQVAGFRLQVAGCRF